MTNQYGDIDTYFDHVGPSADRINSSDTDWIFDPILDFMDSIGGYVYDQDEVVLQLNQQYDFENSDMEAFIDFKFSSFSEQARSEFVQRILEYYEKQFNNDGQIHDISISINRNSSNYSTIISVTPYIVKPEKYDIYYDEEIDEFISGTEIAKGHKQKANEKVNEFDFTNMDKDKSAAVRKALNDLNEIMSFDEEAEDDRVKRPDWSNEPEFK